MKKEIPNAVSEGELKIAGLTLKVAVLEDGSRMIEAESFARFMSALEDGSIPTISEEDSKELARFIRGIK